MDTYKKSGSAIITDGIVSIIAGIALLFLTDLSQQAVTLLFAAYAVGYGITQIIAAKGERDLDRNPSPLRAIGIFSLVAGIILAFLINADLSTIITFIAAHAIITGGAEILASRAYRDELRGNSWFVFAGLIRVVFGLILLFNTEMSLSSLIMTIAWYAIIIGPVLAFYGYAIGTKSPGGWGRTIQR